MVKLILTSIKLKQLLSLYTPNVDSYEDPIPVEVLRAIIKSPNYHPDDRLLLDPSIIQPFPVSLLHYLEPHELDRIAYQSTALVSALMKLNIASKMGSNSQGGMGHGHSSSRAGVGPGTPQRKSVMMSWLPSANR